MIVVAIFRLQETHEMCTTPAIPNKTTPINVKKRLKKKTKQKTKTKISSILGKRQVSHVIQKFHHCDTNYLLNYSVKHFGILNQSLNTISRLLKHRITFKLVCFQLSKTVSAWIRNQTYYRRYRISPLKNPKTLNSVHVIGCNAVIPQDTKA